MIFIYYNNYLNNNIIKKINNTIINIQYIYNYHPFKEGGRSKCKLTIRRYFGGDL